MSVMLPPGEATAISVDKLQHLAVVAADNLRAALDP